MNKENLKYYNNLMLCDTKSDLAYKVVYLSNYKKLYHKLNFRINKAIHLINHNDILDYRVFEKLLLDILEGTSE